VPGGAPVAGSRRPRSGDERARVWNHWVGTSFFEAQFDRDRDAEALARAVVEEQRGSYQVMGVGGLGPAGWADRHEMAEATVEAPCTGDWVLARVRLHEDGAPAHPSRSYAADEVLAEGSGRSNQGADHRANVDTIFLVQSLNGNLNPRRLDAVLALFWESGRTPVVVLSKADLLQDAEPLV